MRITSIERGDPYFGIRLIFPVTANIEFSDKTAFFGKGPHERVSLVFRHEEYLKILAIQTKVEIVSSLLRINYYYSLCQSLLGPKYLSRICAFAFSSLD